MGKKLAGFLAGTLVGSAAALFLAPKSGKELREDFLNKYNMKKVQADMPSEQAEETSAITENLKAQTEEIARQLREQQQMTNQMPETKEEEIIVPLSEDTAVADKEVTE